MLSAISVIRSDMFGARVPETARGAAPVPERRRGKANKKPRRGAPTHLLVVEGETRHPRRARRRPAPHRPWQRRGDQARRRLRLDPSRPDRRERRRVVRRGPRLDQRHLRRAGPHHPAHHDRPRGSRSASARPSWSCGSDLVLHYSAISDVGRVRRENQDSGYAGPWLLTVCDGVGGAVRGDLASSTAVQALRKASTSSPTTACSARWPAPCTAPTTGSPRSSRGSPALNGTSTTATVVPLRRQPVRRRPHRRQPRLPLPWRAQPAHQRPHLRAGPDGRGPITEESRGSTRTAT